MKILDKLLTLFKPWSNLNISTESLRVTITSERVKLHLESLMTNERVRKQIQQMSKLNRGQSSKRSIVCYVKQERRF